MSTDLNEIIDGINSENCTDWLVGYAERLQSEGSNKILVLDINITDLANEKRDNIKEIGSAEYGDWEALGEYIPKEDIAEEKEESEAFISETKEECDACIGFDCDCDYSFHRVLLLCEKNMFGRLHFFPDIDYIRD